MLLPHRLLLGLVLATVSLLAPTATAQQAITDAFDTTGQLNKVKFTGYQSVVRNVGGSYSYFAPNDAVTGDLLITIYSAVSLELQTAPATSNFTTVWTKGQGSCLVGYSVQQVVSVSGGIVSCGNAAVDPFGVLGPWEMLALRTSTTDFTFSGNVATDVASIFASTTSAWATFGKSRDVNFAEFYPPADVSGIGWAAFALDVVDNQSGLVFLSSPSTWYGDIAGAASIYTPGAGQWTARVEDPLVFAGVKMVDPTLTVNEPAVVVSQGSTAANSGNLVGMPVNGVTLEASLGTVTDNGDGTWRWSYDAVDYIPPTEVSILAIHESSVIGMVTFALTVLTTEDLLIELADDVAELNLATGVSNSLDAKLQNALDALDAANSEQRNDAVNKLWAFINSVEVQAGKILTQDETDQLIGAALEIIALLM
ncbi:MAG: hypothetical protein ACYC4U_19205 [Pirellulaceae bacterium]